MQLSSSGCHQLQEGGKRRLPLVHPSRSCSSCNAVLQLAAIGMQTMASCLTRVAAVSGGGSRSGCSGPGDVQVGTHRDGLSSLRGADCPCGASASRASGRDPRLGRHQHIKAASNAGV